MNSYTTKEFWEAYKKLPPPVRTLARKAYRLWRANPRHPSLQFKKIGPRVWSARIGLQYRATAAPVPGGYVWFWIGPHDEYERVIRTI